MGRRNQAGSIEVKGLLIFILVAALGFVIWSKFGSQTQSSIDAAVLPVDDFVSNSNSLRGNKYQVEGKVDDQIYWNADGAQMISVKVVDNGKTTFIPIHIANDYKGGNITREQNYRFEVEILEGGIPKAISVENL